MGHARWLLLATLLPLVCSAQLYKWTDAEGRVHFGDKPPEQQGSQAEQVQVTPPKPLGQGEEVEQINQRLQELRDKEQERKAAAQDAQAKKDKELQRQCDQARRQYKKLGRNFVYEREDGSAYQVSREQADKDREEVRLWIEQNCAD